MVNIYIWSIVVWSSICVRFSENSGTPDFGTCLTASKDFGVCVHLQRCTYIKQMAAVLNGDKYPRQALYYHQSQCGEDNKYTDNLYKTLVCCSKKFLDENIIPGDVLPQEGICGVSTAEKLNFRILGRNETELYEFPWMALLEYKNRSDSITSFECHGALINHRYVLTAAQCVSKEVMDIFNRTLTRVRLGEFYRYTNPDCAYNSFGEIKECANPHIDVNVEYSIAHELYGAHSLYDIGLIRLAEYVSYTTSVKPICLPISKELRAKQFRGHEMELSGWGRSSTYGNLNAIKLKTSVTAWALEDCQRRYLIRNVNINETQLCAGGQADVGYCFLDIGGPLMYKEKFRQTNINYAVGIISYGMEPCGVKHYPGVYTRVGSFIDWILDNLRA